jgi:hypothetical protein
MGLFSRNKNSSIINLDWSPLTPPKDADEHIRRTTLDSVMIEREPSRIVDTDLFYYLDHLPETKGIIDEKLIASGPSTLFFSNKSQPATAFLTDKRLVHLTKHKGKNYASGSSHDLLVGLLPESTWNVTVNWRDDRCPVLGFGPRFSENGKENRYAMEWWYSFAQIAKDHLV